MLFQLTNVGQPVIEVEDANFRNRSELLLVHRHDEVDLDDRYSQATLKNLHILWKRPVHIATIKGDRSVLLSYDGTEHSESGFDNID